MWNGILPTDGHDWEGAAFEVSITSDIFDYSFKPSTERKLQLFSEYGFRFIHWCDDWNNCAYYTESDAKRYRALVKNAGLMCIDVHGTANDTVCIHAAEETCRAKYLELLENRIRFCASLGGDVVVIHPPSGEPRSLTMIEGLDRSLDALEKIRPLCGKLGIALAIENCSASANEVLEFYCRRFPPDFVGFCFDSGHANKDGNFEQLMAYGQRLKALHLNDNRGEKDDHQPPFWGTVDWERVISWIKETEYSKPINFEITHNPQLFSGTMEEYLKCCTEAIRKVMELF